MSVPIILTNVLFNITKKNYNKSLKLQDYPIEYFSCKIL